MNRMAHEAKERPVSPKPRDAGSNPAGCIGLGAGAIVGVVIGERRTLSVAVADGSSLVRREEPPRIRHVACLRKTIANLASLRVPRAALPPRDIDDTEVRKSHGTWESPASPTGAAVVPLIAPVVPASPPARV